MKKFALLIAAAATAAAIFAAAPASAQDSGMRRERGVHHGEMHRGGMKRLPPRMHRGHRMPPPPMRRHRRHMMD